MEHTHVHVHCTSLSSGNFTEVHVCMYMYHIQVYIYIRCIIIHVDLCKLLLESTVHMYMYNSPTVESHILSHIGVVVVHIHRWASHGRKPPSSHAHYWYSRTRHHHTTWPWTHPSWTIHSCTKKHLSRYRMSWR